MKKIAIALFAAIIMTANAEEIPHRLVDGAVIAPSGIILSSQHTEWRVIHECNLAITRQSLVSIKPAGRTRVLAAGESLLVVVDGERHVCDIRRIDRI